MTASRVGANAIYNGDARLYPIIMGAHDMVSRGGWSSPTRADAYVDCLVYADCGLRLESVHRYADGATLFAHYTREPGAPWNSPPDRCDALASRLPWPG